MNSYLDNLRPAEKRIVVGVAVLFFIVLNVWFVIPHFSDWGKTQFRREQAEAKLAKFRNEIAQEPTFRRLVKELENEGLAVPLEEQALHFASAIQSQAAQSQVQIIQNSHISTDTNSPFFLEKSQSLQVQAQEPKLVDFLYSLGSGNSLIRVRDLSLRPDAARQQLTANVKLVASYQKKVLTKAGASPSGATPGTTAKN